MSGATIPTRLLGKSLGEVLEAASSPSSGAETSVSNTILLEMRDELKEIKNLLRELAGKEIGVAVIRPNAPGVEVPKAGKRQEEVLGNIEKRRAGERVPLTSSEVEEAYKALQTTKYTASELAERLSVSSACLLKHIHRRIQREQSIHVRKAVEAVLKNNKKAAGGKKSSAKKPKPARRKYIKIDKSNKHKIYAMYMTGGMSHKDIAPSYAVSAGRIGQICAEVAKWRGELEKYRAAAAHRKAIGLGHKK